MFIILGILLAGIAAGYTCRRAFKIQLDTDRFLTLIVRVMLMAFGADIGYNPAVMADLHVLGLHGLLFGASAFAGSATACMLLQRLASRANGDDANRSRPAAETSPHSPASALRSMAGSAATVAFFAAGIAGALTGFLPVAIDYGSISATLLYVLIASVGLGLGNRSMGNSLRGSLTPAAFLIAPVSIAGTVAAGVAVGLLPCGFGIADSIAGVSGMGYYSLSSLMIAQLKAPAMGAAAMQLGAVALLGNIVRELLALLLAPLLARHMGAYALIGGAGVTSLDVCLPAICGSCGPSAATPALINGLTLEILCPFLITAACSL